MRTHPLHMPLCTPLHCTRHSLAGALCQDKRGPREDVRHARAHLYRPSEAQTQLLPQTSHNAIDPAERAHCHARGSELSGMQIAASAIYTGCKRWPLPSRAKDSDDQPRNRSRQHRTPAGNVSNFFFNPVPLKMPIRPYHLRASRSRDEPPAQHRTNDGAVAGSASRIGRASTSR